MPLNRLYDIAVLGSGFAGSLCSMIGRKQGRSVVMLERGRHPRVVIGESSTPLSNLLLEELATRYDLPDLQPLVKWGSWQAHYPGVACGLKRGFSFFHHELDSRVSTKTTADNHLLVAASPYDTIADTHWYRADFDRLLVQQAKQLGADYEEEVQLQRVIQEKDWIQLAGIQRGNELALRARFVIDATGPRGCLHHSLRLQENELPQYPATQALYSHFRDVRQGFQDQYPSRAEKPPYPVEDAAVHHIFPGGWIWVLRFNNGITSAGVAATERIAKEFRFSDGQLAWERLLKQMPALGAQFDGAHAVLPFSHLPRLCFRSATIQGSRWAMLPSAAGFVDPLLSTGFPLTLLGIHRLMKLLAEQWEQPALQADLFQYAVNTDAELEAVSRLIASLYATMENFPAFRAVSLLYFAAASFSEATKRLHKDCPARGFLLHDDPTVGPAYRRLLERARLGVAESDTSAFIQDVWRAIEPIDVAGLSGPRRQPWYPVDANDLRKSAWKLRADDAEIEAMLERSGFTEKG